ncbi:MAG: glycoside hydrolase family 2 TIM barrel-domain containing protein [Ginsengibacter sp.]
MFTAPLNKMTGGNIAAFTTIYNYNTVVFILRTSHNPPAPELLDLTDRMGFLVIDEIFDCWQKGKIRWIFT